MKKRMLIGLLLLLTLFLSACQTLIPTQNATNKPSEETEYVYGEHATVESVEVLLMESFPLQAQAVVSGYLPDGCTELDEITVARDGDTFVVTVGTRKLTGDVACTEALVPFEESVSLEIVGLDAGTYTVISQDQSATFTLDVDNVLEQEETNMKFTYGENAKVKEMYVEVLESFPVQIRVQLVGYLPDGCTKIDEVNSSRDGDAFTIEIITKRPTDMICTMAIVPFEETVMLDVEGLPAGEYTVVHNEIAETFRLEIDKKIPND